METKDIERLVYPAMRQYSFEPSEIVAILETHLKKILSNLPNGKGTVSIEWKPGSPPTIFDSLTLTKVWLLEE